VSNSPIHSLLQPDLRIMLEEKDLAGLAEFCGALFPPIAADVMDDMSVDDVFTVLSQGTPHNRAEILVYFPLPFQLEIAAKFSDEEMAGIIEEMPPDDRADLLERFDKSRVENLLPLMTPAHRSDIRQLLSYEEGTAGSIMTTDYASLSANLTVDDALLRLRKQALDKETIYYIYITDDAQHLVGNVSLRRLLLAKEGSRLSEIMERDVISVRVNDDQEVVAREMNRYGFLAIPVVDSQNRLVGIVTHDDAAEVLQEEATEDAQRLAAIAPLEDSYLDTPVMTLLWKRGIWLVILMGASFLTAAVLKVFQGSEAPPDEAVSVASKAWMLIFLPLVLASGGNTGSQSATLVIRAMALDAKRGAPTSIAGLIAWKELRIGALLGLALGSLGFAIACLLVHPQRAVVVSLTVFFVVICGTFVGGLLPVGLRRLGVDPALMSNALIAALSDMLGVIIYYAVANVMLGA
jgi:magnesium transporter